MIFKPRQSAARTDDSGSRGLTHAISPDARDYLERVFVCTTFVHLMRLGEFHEDGGPNVFDENVEHCPGDDVRLDQEIGSYILAVKENREPYDPAEHEFNVSSVSGKHELFIRGVATADEWESLGNVDSNDPGVAVYENLFNELIAPREDTRTYYPEKAVAIRPVDKIHFPSVRKGAHEDKYVEVWQDENGTIQIRLTDNADGLITRITIGSGGVDRLWHPGTGGDDDDVQEVFLKAEPWPKK